MFPDKLDQVLPSLIWWILDILAADCLDWRTQLHTMPLTQTFTDRDCVCAPASSKFIQEYNQNSPDWPHDNLATHTHRAQKSAAGGGIHPECYCSCIHVQRWQDGLQSAEPTKQSRTSSSSSRSLFILLLVWALIWVHWLWGSSFPQAVKLLNTTETTYDN